MMNVEERFKKAKVVKPCVICGCLTPLRDDNGLPACDCYPCSTVVGSSRQKVNYEDPAVGKENAMSEELFEKVKEELREKYSTNGGTKAKDMDDSLNFWKHMMYGSFGSFNVRRN